MANPGFFIFFGFLWVDRFVIFFGFFICFCVCKRSERFTSQPHSTQMRVMREDPSWVCLEYGSIFQVGCAASSTLCLYARHFPNYETGAWPIAHAHELEQYRRCTFHKSPPYVNGHIGVANHRWASLPRRAWLTCRKQCKPTQAHARKQSFMCVLYSKSTLHNKKHSFKWNFICFRMFLELEHRV